jgi:hypothetical protein
MTSVSSVQIKRCNLTGGSDVITAFSCGTVVVESSSLVGNGTFPGNYRSSGISYNDGANVVVRNCQITTTRNQTGLTIPIAGVDHIPSGAAATISLYNCNISVSSGENESALVSGLYIGYDNIYGTANVYNCRIITSTTGTSSVYDLYCYAKGTIYIADSSYNRNKIYNAGTIIESNLRTEINDLRVLCEQWLFEELSMDVAPDGGDGTVNFLDWAIFAADWQITVDFETLADFADQWLKTGANYYIADIAPAPDGDGIVNMLDFAALANNWLVGVGN